MRTRGSPNPPPPTPSAPPTADRPPSPSPARFEVFTAGATATNRKVVEANQDRWGHTALAAEAGRAVVLCDGVGSQPDSGEVAQWAVDAALGCLGAHDPDTATAAVTATVQAALADAPIVDGNATLMAVSAHRVGQIDIAYVGNGAILEVAAVDLGEGRTKLRWINHTLPQVDKNHALTSFVGPTAPLTEPYLAAFVLPAAEARLFLVCSDGIYTAEEAPPGCSPDGSVWQSVPEPLVRVLGSLEDAWVELVTLPVASATPHLQHALTSAMADLQASGQLEDDATVAAALLRSSPTDTGVP